MTKPYRIGLLGASRIARGAVLAPARPNADFVVSAVAARDPTRAWAYAAEEGIDNVADSYDALIAREDIDVVYNALPPAGHAEWTIAALKAGKDVLCEKPFARNGGEARAMVETAQAEGRILIEAFHYRFHNVMRRAVDLVQSGVLGRLRGGAATFQVPIPKAEGEFRWSAAQGGGALMDLGCYPLHALRTLIGSEPVVTRANGVFDDGVDAAMRADFVFADDVTGSIACSMIEETPTVTLRLEGERGALDILNFLAPQMGCRFATTIDGDTVRQPTEGPGTYAAQLIHLAQVLEGETPPLTGGADAIANMTAIDDIYAAARKMPAEDRP